MASRIIRLSDSLVDKIAAGEVVERPASAVKELVENSLDAGARKIEVDLADAGKKLIRVSDDGEGIAAEDVALAVARHATSKISSEDDLFSIRTLGFRGEALAAIASVSELRLASRQRGALEGREIRVSGGKAGEPKACGMPEGTAVEVSNLFFNVPARRKFLRFARTELSQALEMVNRYALAFPKVHFVVTHNGRSVMNLPPARSVRERVEALFGREAAEPLLETGGDGLLANGLITPASVTRPNLRLQYFFLNGRYIKDRTLSHAASEAYRGMIPQGRYPAYFISLRVPPEEVDVNVHPTKIEVRFRNQGRIHDELLQALRERLGGSAPAKISAGPSAEEIAEGLMWRLTSKPTQRSFEAPRGQPQEAEVRPQPAAQGTRGAVFQLLGSYLVAERPEGLVIIDQHALHERIIFEELKSQLAESKMPAQAMLIPEPVELLPEEAERLEAARGSLERLGVKFERMSRKAVVVRSVPQLLARANPRELLEGVLERLGEAESAAAELPLEAVMEGLACKAAVKAGEKLTPEEMASLLERAGEVKFQATCPHGRPTALILGREELEKRFGRK